jgi:hypothetical protein
MFFQAVEMSMAVSDLRRDSVNARGTKWRGGVMTISAHRYALNVLTKTS